jgi:aquaporin Z
LIPVTNASINPARSTGPALFAGGAYIGQLWLFWLAPCLGAALAGFVGRWQHEVDHPIDVTRIMHNNAPSMTFAVRDLA